MGCCKSVQSSEEENILSFFKRKFKENNFHFTIKNYQENYDKILKYSGNNYKRLCKKQSVRLNFIEILKKGNVFIKNNKQKEEDITKILYYIMVLTILLEIKQEEFEKNIIEIEDINYDTNQINLINLKRELLELGYNLFQIEFVEFNNIKIIIYYLAKLFGLCFKDFNDTNNIVSLKNYIEKIKLILDSNILSDEEEQYIFVKDNILTLGEYFNYNNYNNLDEEIPEIIMELSAIVLNHWHDYFLDNIQLIRESINKNIRNATDKLINYEETNFLNEKKINDNISLEELNSDNDNIFHKDLKLIFGSMYNIYKKIIQDIYSGKNTIIALGNKLISKDEDKYQFDKIIIFMLFYECYIKSDEKLILCFMDHITDLYMSNEIILNDNNNIYYDIALNSYYLIYKNQQLCKQYISLLTQIFSKEMENKTINNNQILIVKLIQIYQKKENNNKITKLFFYFILSISRYYNNLINSNNENGNTNNNEINKKIIKNIFNNLNSIIKIYFINNNTSKLSFLIKEKGGAINTINLNNLSTNTATYNTYNSDKILTNYFKISIISYETITTNFFNFKKIKNELVENIEFYLYFHIFIINNMNILILINDFTYREKIYHNFFKIITQFEIIQIQESYKENNFTTTKKDEINNNINDILLSLQIILKINDLTDSKNYIQDCYLFYKSMARNIHTLLELEIPNDNNNYQIEANDLKIIYSIVFFILCQFIILINVPNSIPKLNLEIKNKVRKLDEKIGNLLSKINISNFIVNENSNENQNFNYLKELISKVNCGDNFKISHALFKQILEIIFKKLFDKNSSLNIFFDNQICNSNYFCDTNNCFNKSTSKLNDSITEGKENSFINQDFDNLNENIIEDISIKMLDSKKKSLNNISEMSNKIVNINIPSENIAFSNKLLSNSFTLEDNQYQNIKV